MIGLANKMWSDMNDARVQPGSGEKGKGMLPMGNNHITKMWALTRPDIGKTVEANIAMIDEAQDMNPVFAQILKDSNGVQRIYIGDTNQAINAWRGADGSTLDNAYAKYTMPITDSFRFGKEIADRGNRFLSLLGRKERMTGRKTDKSGSPVNGVVGPIDNPTMILTRTNGGAIVATLETFKNGGMVYGSKNFRNDLDAFINNIEYFQTSADGKGYYVNSNGEKVFAPPTPSKDLDGITNLAEFNKAVEDADNNRLNMLAKLLTDNSVDDLRNAIKKIITDKKKLPKDRDSYVHIQTAHTSKGLESPRVKIWSDFRKPKKDENGNVILPDEQELRLSYVAVTRAEEELDLGSLAWIMDYTTDADGASTKLSSGGRAARRVGDTESTTPKDRTSLSSGRRPPWEKRKPPVAPLPARLQKLKDEEDAANGRGGAVDKPKGPPAPPPIPKTATEKPKRPAGPPPIPGVSDSRLSSGKKKKRSSGSKRQPMSDDDRQSFADGVRQRASTIPAKKKSGPDVSEFSLSSGKNNRQRRRMTDEDILPKPLDESGIAELAKGIGSTSRIVVGDVSDNKNRKPDSPWFVESKKIMDLLKDENGELLSDDVLAKAFDIPVEQVAKLRKQGTGIDSESAHKILETTTNAGKGPGGTDDGMRKIWGFDASPHWYDTYDDAENPKKMNKEEFDAMPEEDFKTNVVPMPYEWDDEMSGTGQTEAPVRIRSEVDTTRGTFMLQDLLDYLGKGDATREEIAEILALEINGKKEKPGLDAIYRWRRDGIPKRTMSKIIEDGIIKRAEDVFGDDGKRFDSNIPQPKFLVALDDMLEKAKTPRTQVQMNEILNMKASNQRIRNSRSGKEGKFSWSVGEGVYYTPSEADEILFRLNEKLGTNFTLDDLFPSSDNDSKLPANNPVKDIKPVRMVSPNIPGSKLSSGDNPTPNNGAPENITPKMQKELIAYAKNAKWSNFAQGLIQKLDNGGELSPAQWRALLRMHDNQVKRR
jgi:hypothetical protein